LASEFYKSDYLVFGFDTVLCLKLFIF